MNTQQAKEAFFSQYVEQKVQLGNGSIYTLVNSQYGRDKDKTIRLDTALSVISHLCLRHIEDLTVDHAKTIAWILGVPESNRNQVVKAYHDFLDGHISYTIKPKNFYFAIRILINYGYLMLFEFINDDNQIIRLQPEELISLNWAQYQAV